MLTRTGKLVAALLTLAIICGLMIAFTGCTRMMALDEAMWNPPSQTDTEKEAGQPPPLLGTIADIAAAFGLTAMALWIRRNKKHACTKADVAAIVKNNNSPA